MSRESTQLILGTSAFSHIHPAAKLATSLTLINLSPTEESFTYDLTQLQETNLFGLKLFINGQILNSDPTTLQFALNFGVNLIISIEVEIGDKGYSFHDIAINLQSPDGDSCLANTASISVDYE